jgi:putative membrane protein
MMYGFHGFGWPGMIVGWILVAALLVGLVLLIIWAVRRSSGGSAQNVTPQAPSAKEIAQMRYAKGEINREEYQQILSDLSH